MVLEWLQGLEVVKVIRALLGWVFGRQRREAAMKAVAALEGVNLLDNALWRGRRRREGPGFLDHGLPWWVDYHRKYGYIVHRPEAREIVEFLCEKDREAPCAAVVGDGATGKTVIACLAGIVLRGEPGRPGLHVRMEAMKESDLNRLTEAVEKVAHWARWSVWRWAPTGLLVLCAVGMWRWAASEWSWVLAGPLVVWATFSLIERRWPNVWGGFSFARLVFWPWRPVVVIDDLHRNWNLWDELRRNHIPRWPAVVVATARGALREHRVGPGQVLEGVGEAAGEQEEKGGEGEITGLAKGRLKVEGGEMGFLDEEKLWGETRLPHLTLALTRQKYEDLAPKLVNKVMGRAEDAALNRVERQLIQDARCNLLALYHLLLAMKERGAEEAREGLYDKLAVYLAGIGARDWPDELKGIPEAKQGLPVVVAAVIYRFEEVPVHRQFVVDLLKGSVEGFPQQFPDLSERWVEEVEKRHWLTHWGSGLGRWNGLPHAGIAELIDEMLRARAETEEVQGILGGIAPLAGEIREFGARVREAYLRWLVEREREGGEWKEVAQAALDDLAGRVIPVIVLESEDVRDAAAAALRDLGEGGLERCIKALRNGNAPVRGGAAWALGEIGSDRAVGVLVERLGDQDAEVRSGAAWALGKIGEPALQPCIDALKSPKPAVRWAAADALGWIGSEKAVGVLVERLEDEDEGVRWAAARALGRVGSGKAVGPLVERLEDEDEMVRWWAALALGKIGERALQPCIDALKSPNPGVREAAAWALGWIRSEEGVGPLVGGLEDEDEMVRMAAAWALGEIGGSRALEALRSRLDAERDGRVRVAIRSAIGRIESRRGER